MNQILPIGGGKGGAGKSFVTAGLGALLAKQRKKVVLVDLDLGASNLHTMVGLKPPENGLHGFMDKSVTALEHTAVPTLIPNLFLISSAHCSMEIANLYYQQKIRIIKAIRELPYDFVLLDLGAGTSFNTLDFFLTSHVGIMVFTPEPTSVENTIRFIRTVYLRKLKVLIKKHAFHAAVKESVALAQKGELNTPDVIDRILNYDPEKEPLLRSSLARFRFNMVLNQFRKTNDAKLGEKLKIVCNRHFYSGFEFLGNIGYDDRVHVSVNLKKLFVNKYPHTETATDLKGVTRELMSVCHNRNTKAPLPEGYAGF
ncbi:MAG: MinD/ParA family protein [Desulfobacterales bacterium]|nr:MinD/ParA family protein [Desulfobacterales bacterium]